MEGDHIKNYNILLPLAWLYGLGVRFRNMLFDSGILKSKAFDIPIICVGNITVGGTGKTPHTEYLIHLLQDRNKVAVLSRGYKRKTKGFVLASQDSKMSDIGDEPYQMKQKFPSITMAVDADRCNGIEHLTDASICPKPDVIILDDAYQHRYVKAGINILLMDYHRLIHLDKLLPAGRLREPVSGIKRADIIIITKCPKEVSQSEQDNIANKLNLENRQKLYFTTYKYPDHIANISENPLVVTGIASPQQLEFDLKKLLPRFEMMSFPDHHNYTESDVEKIRKAASGRTILTTEKDATRLHGLDNMQVIPIEVEFLGGKKTEFDEYIKNYINSCKEQKLQN